MATDDSTSESSDGATPSTLSSSSSDSSDESEGSPMLDCSDPDVIFCDDFESGMNESGHAHKSFVNRSVGRQF